MAVAAEVAAREVPSMDIEHRGEEYGVTSDRDAFDRFVSNVFGT